MLPFECADPFPSPPLDAVFMVLSFESWVCVQVAAVHQLAVCVWKTGSERASGLVDKTYLALQSHSTW